MIDVVDRKNTFKFMKWLKNGKTVLYAPDQDYGLDKSKVIKFFGHPAATVSAPYKIIQKTKCKTFFLNSYIKIISYSLILKNLIQITLKK